MISLKTPLLLVLLASSCGSFAQGPGFQPLFDGSSLTGWNAFPTETASAWSVRDGVIHGESNGGPESYLGCTHAAFGDFELKLEYRFLSEEANSGVQVRSHLPDEQSERLRGYHADFGHVGIGHKVLGAWDWHGSKRGDTLVNRGQQATFGEDGKRSLTKLENTLQPADVKVQDWNYIHIVASGDRLHFTINGKLASEVIDRDPKQFIRKGYIGFQLHSGDKMVVQFRKIMVKTLLDREIKPHPDAVPNQHRVGEVDVPENVTFVVPDAATLPGIVLDETDAILQGSWQYSTHTPPYVGLGYLHDQSDGKGEKSVTWTPDIPKAGNYQVRLSHCYNSKRATAAPVTIEHATGKTLIHINEQEVPEHDRLFRSLGTFHFQAGTAGKVTISNGGTSGKYVIADAVQFLPVSD